VANEVATAAGRTLTCATARVWHRYFAYGPEDRLERFVATQEGVTDMVRRRTRTECEVPRALYEWGAWLVARYPWLDDGQEDKEHEGARFVVVYAGTARFVDLGTQWSGGDDGDETARARNPLDPVWIVEVLAHADEVVARGEDVVRGVSCRRWEFRVDPARHPEAYARTGGPRRKPLRLAGDAWIDHEGRLRRVTWTRLRRHRPRWRGEPWSAPRGRQTTELWDFGLPVEIEVPIVEPERLTPWPVALVMFPAASSEFAWKLWRRKRAYEHRQRGT
jgi:hypothetical protein